MDFFKYLYMLEENTNLEQQLKILKYYPIFFSEEEGNEIGKEAELEKVKGVLSLFAKEKIHGPYGWSVEFFVHF